MAIREATYSGRLGSREFVSRLEAAMQRKLGVARPGRPNKEISRGASA
jgi:hypothetical protein